MGELIRSEFRDAVRFHLDQKQTISVAELDRWINMSYIHLCQPHIYMHREMHVETVAPFGGVLANLDLTNTALNDGTYNSRVNNTNITDPGNLLALMSITLIENSTDVTFPLSVTAERKPLRPIQRWEWETVQIPTGTSEPNVYTMWDRILYFDSVPAATDTCLIRWYREPKIADFNDVGERTALPSMWDDTIIVGAVWRGWRALGQYQQAYLMREEYLRLIREGSQYMNVEARHRQMRFDVEGHGTMAMSMGSRG